jgi:glycine/D-amino acid oxidase-like deaminating enzyme
MNLPRGFGALVVGGGVQGLATALELARRGVERVGLVERFRLHHDRGSSHGAGRITRSTYMDARYVRLMQVAHREDWPRLEHDSRMRLVHRADGVFFGPPAGALEQYAAAVQTAGAPGIERLDVREARRRFPAFAFPDAREVLHDTTGGVVAAADTLLALDRRCRIEGVHVLEETHVRANRTERRRGRGRDRSGSTPRRPCRDHRRRLGRRVRARAAAARRGEASARRLLRLAR